MKKIVYLLLFLISFKSIQAQTINTVAGDGTAAYSGDGSAATSASINKPIGCYVDVAGNLYISDQQNNRIRKVNTSGVISTIAGTGIAGYSGDGGLATAAKINTPGAVFVDASGNVYFADGLNNAVRKVTTSGIITTIAGTGTAGYSGDGGAATAAKIYNPIGVTMDAAGNIYVADQRNHRIRKINTSGIISTVAGTGTIGYTGDGGPATAATLSYPNYISNDGADNLLVTDNGNHCIRKISISGTITTIAGNGSLGFSGDGGSATSARMSYPTGTTMDPSGNLYISDYGNHRIRKVSTTGIITTVVGTGVPGFSGDGGPAISAQLNNPADIIYRGGCFYIADYLNNRIRRVGVPDNVPFFTEGASSTLTVCINAAPTSIDWLLRATDADAGQMLTWSVVAAPTHGTASAAYATSSTGGVVVPTGLTYTPSVGYSGSDMFKVIVNDGTFSDTITINVTVDALPSAGVIVGTNTVCPTSTTTLSNPSATPVGAWASSTTGIATIGATTGIVTGVAAGTSTISYTTTNSCGTATTTRVVTVNPLPNAGTITGTATVCPTATTTLSNSGGDAGGVWTSVTTATATIGASTGIVTGVTGGTSTISYTVTNSCGTAAATRVVTVNAPNAGSITGPSTVCPTATITLSNPTGDAGGAWTSSTTAVATIGATTGIVTGVTNGTSTISYTVTNSCGTARATKVVTVSPPPSAGTITGPSTVCPGGAMTLSDVISGGVWSSSVPARATVSSTGVVSGVSAGTTTISYSVTNSCSTAVATKVVTVNPSPNAGTITGTASMCPGFSTTLSDAITGGIWSSTTTGVATVDAFGVVNGLTAGTTTISYAVTNSCGTAAATVVATVNPIPAAIAGSDNVCEVATIALTDGDPGGAWSSGNANATVGASSGIVTGVSFGTVVITYTLPTSCFITKPLTVNSLPATYSVTGGGSYCAGGTGVHIGLSGSNAGVDYQLYNGAATAGSAVAGTGSALDFGSMTAAGTYTVLATNTTTSCTRMMSGSATIVINPYFVPSVSIIHSYAGASTCNGASATFTAIATNGGPTPGYQWYVNGVAVGSSVSYSYVPANGDVVSVTLIPGGICASPATVSASYTVSVLPVGAPTVTIASSPTNPICAGTTVLCTSVTTFAGTVPTYLWLKNGINVATGSTYSFIPSNGDVVLCKITSNYVCRTADIATSNTLTMVVQANVPAPVVNINATPGTTISAGQTVTFSALATGGSAAKKYQWFINGTIVSGATNSTFTSTTLTNGNIVTCHVTNNDACANSTDKSVTISVGGVGVAATVQANKLLLYPNPNDGTFVVSIPSIKKSSAHVVILNALGQKVKEFEAVTNEDVAISFKASPGIYFISAVTEEAVFSTRFELH